MPPHSITGGVASPASLFSDGHSQKSSTIGPNRSYKKLSSNAGSKSELVPKANTARRLACDICRERKVRCDKADPKCSRCIRLDYHCSYNGRKGHRASQADLPRQLSELQDRLAQAEAILTPLKSTPTMQDLQNSAESRWQFVTPPELNLDYEKTNMVPSYVPFVDHGVGGFDNLPDFTENAPDYWDSGIDWPSTVTSMPEILPTPEIPELATPMESGELPGGHSSIQQNFDSHSFSSSRNPVDEEVSSQDLALLHHNYFEIFYQVMPILSKQRFLEEWSKNSDCSAIRALSYAVALVGCIISPQYSPFQQACYSKARKYVESCERERDGMDLASPNVFQALLFIIRYELTSKQLTRAWMTLGRTITLAKMLNLHQMDSTNSNGVIGFDPEIRLSPIRDPTSLEELRRSFWALYTFESYASIRTQRPCQLTDVQILVHLPSPGHLAENFAPSPMPFLNEASKLGGGSHTSPYMGIVLMVTLARVCHEHIALPATDAQGRGFWDRHYALVKQINDYTAIMRMHLTAKAVCEDAFAFTLHTNLCAVHMFLHEAAIMKVDEQELPKLVAAESRKSSTAAAFKISSAIRMTWPAQRSERDFFTLQATFIGWPLVMSMNALSRSLLDAEDATSTGTTDSLRLLLAVLDQVEEKDGYWHKASAGAVATLQKWDEKQGGF